MRPGAAWPAASGAAACCAPAGTTATARAAATAIATAREPPRRELMKPRPKLAMTTSVTLAVIHGTDRTPVLVRAGKPC